MGEAGAQVRRRARYEGEGERVRQQRLGWGPRTVDYIGAAGGGQGQLMTPVKMPEPSSGWAGLLAEWAAGRALLFQGGALNGARRAADSSRAMYSG